MNKALRERAIRTLAELDRHTKATEAATPGVLDAADRTHAKLTEGIDSGGPWHQGNEADLAIHSDLMQARGDLDAAAGAYRQAERDWEDRKDG